MTRKDAKYCAGRFSMPDQAAITTSGVVNAVSTMSGSEMPSMPRWYQAFTAPIHGSRSTNCSAGVARSNAHHSGTHRPSVASVAASATQRPAAIRRSPSSRTTALAAIGSQTSQLRMCAGAVMSRPQEQPAEQQRQADDHGEGIVVEVAGLDAAHDASASAATARALPLTSQPSITVSSPRRQRLPPKLRTPAATTFSLNQSK